MHWWWQWESTISLRALLWQWRRVRSEAWGWHVADRKQQMWALLCHSLVNHLSWQFQILHANLLPWYCWSCSSQIFCSWHYRYCNLHYDANGDDNSVPQDVTMEEMCLFLAFILNMGHVQRDTLKEYCSRDPMCHTSFYSSVMWR
jgi:hypothetical protein